MEKRESAWERFIVWFSGIIAALAIARTFYWLWKLHPLYFLAVIGIILFVVVAWYREKRRRQREGYWIEVLSPGQVRGGDEEWAIVYHQGEQSVWFSAREIRRGKIVLRLPSEERWVAETEEWAWSSRDIIVARIRAKLQRGFVIEEEGTGD